MLTFYGGIGLFHLSSKCHKVLCHPCKFHGGVLIMMEQRHVLGNVAVPQISKINPLTIRSFCEGDGQILNPTNVL